MIVGNGPALRDAAVWFDVLKRERRRLRITAGNAQELYFPVCFELAVTKGAPSGDDDEAATVLRDIHADRDRTGIEVLNQFVADQQVVAKLLRAAQSTAGGTCGRAARSPARSSRAFPPCSGPPRATATRWRGNGSGRR